MARLSAGILLYRKVGPEYEVLLVHPGGPFWAKKDVGSWSAPKGEYTEGEDPLAAAKREFQEETGGQAPAGEYVDLGDAKQSGGKLVHLWATEGDFDLKAFHSNTFEMEWPPKSGNMQAFPECDRAVWVQLKFAAQKVVKGQVVFIERLAEQLHTETAEQVSLF